jgi:N-hydroxyarylamine O-acetyltransferase
MKDVTRRYLEKLAINQTQEPLALLQEICEKHLSTFCFNNIEVLLYPNRILSLELEDIAAKIIDQGLGGYCFEHNKLLFSILQDLEFRIEAQLARVLLDRIGDFPRTHRTTLVEIEDETYLIDVGFGPNTPLVLVPLSGAQIDSVNGSRYRISETSPSQYVLEVLKEGNYFKLYSFDRGNVTEPDFDMANYYTNCHPTSKFVKELVVSKVDAQVRSFIAQKTFSRITREGRDDKTITSLGDLDYYLKSVFHIELSNEFLDKLFKVIER